MMKIVSLEKKVTISLTLDAYEIAILTRACNRALEDCKANNGGYSPETHRTITSLTQQLKELQHDIQQV